MKEGGNTQSNTRILNICFKSKYSSKLEDLQENALEKIKNFLTFQFSLPFKYLTTNSPNVKR